MAIETDTTKIQIANLSAPTPEVAPETAVDEGDLSFLDDVPETPAETVAEKTTPETESTPVKPSPENQPEPVTSRQTHPPALVEAARNLGIDERHIDGVSTDALFNVVMQLATRAPALPNPVQPVVQEEDDDAAIKYLDEEVGADKKLVNLLRRQSQKIKQLEGTNKRIEQIEQRDAHRQAVTTESAIEEAIEELGPDYEPFLGKGPLRQMADSDEKASRVDVYKLAGIDMANDAPSVAKRKYKATAARIYKKVIAAVKTAPKENVYDPIAGKPGKTKQPTAEEWDRGGMGKAGGSKSKRDETLEKIVQDAYRERNIVFNGSNPKEDFDGIPD